MSLLDEMPEKDKMSETGKSPSQPSQPSPQGGAASQNEGKSVTPSSHKENIKDSEKAKQLSLDLKNTLAWDDVNDEWYKCSAGIWKKVSYKAAMRLINAKLSVIYPNGFSLSFLNSITQFLQLYLYNDVWNKDRNLLPLKNGVLDLKTKVLSVHSSYNKFTWQLPFKYIQGSQCPSIKEWLDTATNNNSEVIKTIQACFYLALSGTSDIQKFLEVIGPGGTGKSTLVRLLIALIGKENHLVTDLKNLENNRFESAIFYGKRLAVISDSSRYGGEVSQLKAITGGDPIRMEKKNRQQDGSFVADCFVIIASNEAIQSSDYSSGMSRRRIPITFERRVSDADKEKWRELGGLENVMHQELSGLLNWVLELSIDDVRAILGGPNGEYSVAQKHHLISTNKIAAWLDENCILREDAETYIGTKPKKIASDNSVHEKLYPSYLNWCDGANVNPIALQRFGATLDDLCQTLKFPTKLLKKDRYGRRFSGLALRRFNDTELTPITETDLNNADCDEVCRSSDEPSTSATRTSDECDDCDGLLPVPDNSHDSFSEVI